RDGKAADWLALIAAVNSTANLEQKETGKMQAVGNSTEGALLHWLHENGLVYQNLRLQFPAAYQIHFSSERKHMTTVIPYGNGLTAVVRGAPEVILAMSDRYLAADGDVKPWTDEARAGLTASLKVCAGQAMRTLAFAYKPLPADILSNEDAI